MLHANFTAVHVIGIENFNPYRSKCCRLFCACDLDLDPMTFIYEPDLYSLEIQRMCKYELPMSRLSKVIV